MKWVGGAAAVLVLLACTSEPPRLVGRDADSGTSAPGSTEPDVITEFDTLGPAPIEPSFRLAGNEPFWSLTIDSAGLRFRTPEDTSGQRFAATLAVLHGDSLRWNSSNDNGMIEVVVAPARCPDTMADKVWPYRATVLVGKARYTGCGERR